MILGQSAHAGENRTEIRVDFRVNVARIEPGFSDNALKITEIVSYIQQLRKDPTLTITSVEFCGAASPEGPYEWNRYLAGARLTSLEKLIRSKVSIPDSIVSRDDSYIPWEYLRERLAESDHAYKDAVVSIIDDSPALVKDPDNGKLVDRRIVKLKQLDGRRVWDELFRLYFGKMRNAVAVIITYRKDRTAMIPAAPEPSELPGLPEPTAPSRAYAGSETEPGRKPFRMAISTNMLYDALAVPNLGVEFYLGNDWSIAGNWMYAWWDRDSAHRYWRVYGGDIGVRRWLGGGRKYREALSGHHVGIYGQMLTYDFELGGKGYLGDRWTWGAGVSYGYSLPVGRHLNIDFTIGVGYVRGEYKKYHPADDCYVWDSTHRLNWFGPTKAEVSLVWHINGRPLRKGGVR